MDTHRVVLLAVFAILAGVTTVHAQKAPQQAVLNRPGPSRWQPLTSRIPETAARQARLKLESSQVDLTSPLPFVGVTPCRVADTRGNGFSGAYGPPSIAANSNRTFVIADQCGIPASAAAVSFNFTVLNVAAQGDLRVFPAGSGVPLVSTLNYSASTPNIANAAVVTLGTGGGISVQPDATTVDLIIDVNGYYGGNIVSSVTAGTGLTGGGTGSVTLNLDFAGSGSAATASRSDHTHNAADIVSGLLADSRLGGTYSNALNLSNSSNSFAGNGAALTNVNAALLQGLPPTAFQTAYVRTVVVSPSGTPAQSGTALLNALAGITTASATNPWLLKIEPGIYDIGNSTLVMKPFVDVEGSGELSTTIASSGSITTLTVLGANNSELRFLTLSASSGGSNYANAYLIQSAAARLTHVTIVVSETGGGAGTGIEVWNGSNLAVDHVNVTATAPGGQSGALQCLGSSVSISNSILNAVGGGIQSNGILNDASSVSLQNSVVTASGAPNNVGISSYDLHGAATVVVDTSQITASTHTIFGQGGVSTFVGASKLVGGPVVGGVLTTMCAGVYNGSYAFFANTCP